MSHIVDFRIDGLAGRKGPVEMHLNRDINVIFGLNGSGKTSLLKILHSAMSNDVSVLQNVPFLSADVGIFSLTYNCVIRRSTKKTMRKEKAHLMENDWHELTYPDGTSVSLVNRRPPPFRWITAAPLKEAADTDWHHRYLPTSRLYLSQKDIGPWATAMQRERSILLTDEQLDAFFAKSLEALWNRYTADILRKIKIAHERGLTSILKAVLSSPAKATKGRRRKKPDLETDKAYERVRKFLSRQQSLKILSSQGAFAKRYDSDISLQMVVKDIDQIEIEIEKASLPRVELQEMINKLITGNKIISLGEKAITVCTADGDDIGVVSLSSGEKHLLRILVETLLAEQSSIMIDEPEISMHIDWQKELIKLMKILNPSAQIIVTTHSPEIMADVSDSSIFKL